MNKIPLIENACKELLSYGVWDGRARCKYLIKRYLLRRNMAKEDLIFWPTGLLAAGLWTCREELIKGGQAESAGAAPESAETQRMIKMIENALAAYYERWQKKSMPFQVLDDLLSGEVLLHAFSETEKTSVKNIFGLSREGLFDALERFAAYGANQPTDGAGSFYYRPAHGNTAIFVDGIGLACPYLYQYGETFGKTEYRELAVRQIVNFLSYGMDGGTGLPYHGYDMTDGCKHGIIGWGRAVGWLLRGMVGCLSSDLWQTASGNALQGAGEGCFAMAKAGRLFFLAAAGAGRAGRYFCHRNDLFRDQAGDGNGSSLRRGLRKSIIRREKGAGKIGQRWPGVSLFRGM